MIDNILPLISVTDIFNAKEFFAWFIENASYLFVFVFMVVESSFIPFPSEVVVPPAAYLAVQHGQHAGQDMNVFMVVAVATLGAIVGALINYGLSVWIGRPIVYKFADSRIGHACMIDRAKVEKAERYFDEHGAASTFIGRLIPAVRQLISIPAGIARMNIVKFIVFTGLGALVWNAILAGLGALLARYVTVADLLPQIEKYNSYLSLAGLLILLVCVAVIAYNAFKNKK
ncbi:MAG: DedA family protein [Muribaculaceae bacterium]|nr:DedA family protein [Muribaculaceae bacterium]MDE5929674.1 DedA family protein [Muribaculaceae bacterium]MDE6131620.1 DedA family protein [Muribaculaceae bacterium]